MEEQQKVEDQLEQKEEDQLGPTVEDRSASKTESGDLKIRRYNNIERVRIGRNLRKYPNQNT